MFKVLLGESVDSGLFKASDTMYGTQSLPFVVSVSLVVPLTYVPVAHTHAVWFALG